ncbi:hypothetical protein BKE38_07360 [Pseudoroseomonas deserti]|uniref:Rap1a immunity protein domain-containing protein n=1 Tax=Teichococcus deserti TaxID=1817963 RepID=A0A1V2H4M0_9PROT|nr:hypothetical protein BKE38_07360 [Pseudoroseomonas deserti]
MLGLASGAALAQGAAGTAAAPEPVTQVSTVADLAAICDPAAGSPLRLESIAYCQGFITAAGQYHAALNPPGSAVSRPLFCVPTPAPTVAQTGLGFAAWARANPAHNAEPALDGLLRYAQATYACPPQAAAQPARRAARPATTPR